MSVTRVLQNAGLWRSPSHLLAPSGSFEIANDVVVNYPGIVEPRRGFEYLSYTFGTSLDHANTLFSYRGTVLAQYGSKLASDTGAAFADLAGTNAAPGSYRMRGLEDNLNFYYASTDGVKVLDAPLGTPILAGVLRGPLPTGRVSRTTLTGDPNTGWMPENTQVGYVATFSRTDANDTLHEGTPSNPFFLVNPAGFTIAVGNAFRTPPSGLGTVIINASNHGLLNGDRVTITYDAADVDFVSGTYTVRNATQNQFRYSKNAAAFSATTQPATVTTGSKDVTVNVTLSPDVTTDYTLNVYRTRLSVSATTAPRQQYYLVAAHALTGGEIAAGVATITDSTPDSLLQIQQPLYTNTDDGEPPDSSPDNDNSQPPTATDLELFDGRMWGCNFSELQSFSLALLGVDAPNGLQVGDTITVGGVTYTGVAVGTALGASTFTVQTGYDAGTNVQATAQSLALTIYQNGSSQVDAFYTSGVDDFPGQILLRGRLPTSPQFAVTTSRVSAFNPDLTGGLSSSSDSETNGLWFSKQNQPEAVCLLNRLAVGPRNCRILRVKALRDRLFVFTDIAGIWTISNHYESPYSIDQLTATAALYGPDTLVNFDDALWALSSQGVIRLTAAGPAIESIPIDSDIKLLFGLALSTTKTLALGIGYESYHKYLLALPTDPADTTNTQIFVYDVFTKAWTRWGRSISAGVVVPESDFLYIAAPSNNYVSKERKTFTRTDYSDESFVVNIVSASGTSVTLTDATGVTAGDLLYVDPVARSLVTAVSGNVLTTLDSITWVAGAATIYTGIPSEVIYTPMFSGVPEEWKHYREVQFHFRNPAFNLGNAVFKSDQDPEERDSAVAMGGFGDRPWEGFPWEQPSAPKNKRVWVPSFQQRANYLSVGFELREAQATWQLAGYTPIYESGSERGTTK
jgi:hypothetical protein